MPTPPSQASGYSLVFSDDFDTLSLSPNGQGNYTWYPGLWYESIPPSSNMTVSGSVLNLKWTAGQSPSTDTSIQTYNKANTAGRTWRYGYFECRMKWDAVKGAWPAFWMNGDYGQSNQGFMELDFFEGQGTSGKFYATLHDWIKDSGGTRDRLSDGGNELSSAGGINFGNVDFSQWHTYGCLWTKGQVKWYFDDVLIRTASTPASADTGPELFLILSQQVGPGWNTGGSPSVSTVNNYIDWVRVWQLPTGGSSSSPSISTGSLAAGTVGTSYSQTVAATGGATPYTWAVTSGALPTSLSLNSSTGAITGTPSAAGTYAFSLRVTDANAKTATASFSITVAAASGAPGITTPSIPNGVIGQAYSASQAASGGTTPYVWSLVSGALPAGLSLASATGTISGTPTTAGTSTFVVRVTDANAKSATVSWTVTIFTTIPTSANPPAQASGYTLDFHDEFDALSLSPNGSGSYNWYPGLWYYDASSIPPSSQFSVTNSVANLKWSQATGQPASELSTLQNDGATGRKWRYGYFEARMKWDVQAGAWPEFRLDSGLSGATSSTSIDVFQGQAAQPHTFNASVSAYSGSTQTFESSPTSADLPTSTDFTQFHTYGVLWTPGQVTWYFDDQKLFSSAVPTASDAQSYYLILGMLEGVGFNLGSTTGVSATNLNLYVDWVRVWKAPSGTNTGTGTGSGNTGGGTGTGSTGGGTVVGNTGGGTTAGSNTTVDLSVSYALPYDYPAYFTSQYQLTTRLKSWANVWLNKLDDMLTCLAAFPPLFDIDTAAGNPLDILGQLIGQSRIVGFQPSAGISPRLDDATYKILLKARIAQNQWDGKIDSLQLIWRNLFPGGTLNIQDAQNMTATIICSGAFSSIVQDLIRNGYIVPRPQGVLYNFAFTTLPAFGTDQDNEYIAGWDRGHIT